MVTESMAHENKDRDAYNRKTINRIRRIQGQLSALEAMISADAGSCEERVLRARTIEKGLTSLINHLFDCYIENSLQGDISTEPSRAVTDLQRILKLINN